jgi:cbb3-type cytochrome oxidase subunit 3
VLIYSLVLVVFYDVVVGYSRHFVTLFFFFFLLLVNNFVYSVEKKNPKSGEWYGWNGSRWENSVAPLCLAIEYNIPKHWNSIMEKWDNVYADICAVCSTLAIPKHI